ncbi:rhodanese-like domain-containing protein [Desulfobacula sp.]|uniref:rhodanese-like domain-containing protein n=1 Tax=Desulfobacula sp. TaxID=2593537 RepID=UPI00261937F3|nr:rhodanese-like domain-containing protein [Desulfobacula sp.]
MKQKPLMRIIFLYVIATVLLSIGMSCGSEESVSGSVQDGYRVLDIQSSEKIQQFTVYRGDYIKFRLPKEISTTTIVFPTLKESKPLTSHLETAAYFKMKQTGIYPFNMGALQGQIKVIDYQEETYRELSAQQADDFIKVHHPFVIDVRTLREYKNGHLENAVLLPVQELQKRIGELSGHKNDKILLYCATGNRSTVASKILIDAGFTDIFNLRKGIADWVKHRYPVVQ